jgi:hypothetical protein
MKKVIITILLLMLFGGACSAETSTERRVRKAQEKRKYKVATIYNDGVNVIRRLCIDNQVVLMYLGGYGVGRGGITALDVKCETGK